PGAVRDPRTDVADRKDAGFLASALAGARDLDGSVDRTPDRRTSPADLRRAVLPGARAGIEATEGSADSWHRVPTQRRGPGGDQEGAPIPPDRRTEEGAERDRRSYGATDAHAAPAARRCRVGQNDCGARSRHDRHRERISGGADGTHGD